MNKSSLESFVDYLREVHRLKKDIDYAILHKYGYFYVLIEHDGWEKYIMESANSFGITITKIIKVHEQ